MTSRSPHDFSLWPERARPVRRKLSASRVAGGVAASLVCLVAGYAVVSELVRPTALEAPIGRSWEAFAASEQTGALVAPVAATTASAPASAMAAPAIAPAPPVATRSASMAERVTGDAARPRSRGAVAPVALAPIGTGGPPSTTDGRSVPDGSPKSTPAPAAKAAPAAVLPAKDAVERKAVEPPKEAIVALGEEKPVATDHPKPLKKARKKTRSNTADRSRGGDWQRAEAYPRSGSGSGYGYGYRPGGFYPY